MDRRPDFSDLQRRREDDRAPERIDAHYALELQLADRLRNAAAGDRAQVYGQVYSALFDNLPDHPQKIATAQINRAPGELATLKPLLHPQTRYLEIGCGDADVTFAVAEHTALAYGMDVTDSLVEFDRAPANFRFLKTNGIDIPLPDQSIDLAYSNQLIEHLHPDDAEAQIREVVRVLVPGGRYFVRTPSRLSGPHDVSVFYSYQAQGFHLKEYDYRSLHRLLTGAGFDQVRFMLVAKGRMIPFSTIALEALEAVVGAVSPPIRSKIMKVRQLYNLMGVNAVAIKRA